MGRIHDLVARYLGGREWPYEELSDSTFVMPVAGQSGTWNAYFNVREDEGQLLIHSVLPVEIPEDRRVEAALYLTRANFGLVVGNFEMDLDGNEVRFKTSVDMEGVDVSEALVDHLLLAGIVTTDRYLPGLEAVIAGQDALSCVEAAESD
ncbi:YbjN domain-containing protein [Ferrimicrobium sp.]|uniref:YbjN domain-containing protein n=1 Tax=Ferrimicrobium sp. TaxID=2926050 RepID=UPI00262570EA|nr:YbjN domain-containing protein [Ferrimicrobium sp.]